MIKNVRDERCVAAGIPILFNGLLFVFGFNMLLTKLNHLADKRDGRMSKLEAKWGSA